MDIPEDMKAQLVRELASGGRITEGAGTNVRVDSKENGSPGIDMPENLSAHTSTSGGLNACPSCNISLDSFLESKIQINFCPSCGSKLEGHKDPSQMNWREMLETSIANRSAGEEEAASDIEEVRESVSKKVIDNFGIRDDIIRGILR